MRTSGTAAQLCYSHLDRSFGFGSLDSLPIVTSIERLPELTVTQVPEVAPTVQEVLTEIAVHPNREEEVEEKEPEGVIVEPTTPDVAVVPAKQAQHITRAAATLEDPNDMTGLRRLASAVIVQAIEDKATPWFFSSSRGQSASFGVLSA